MKDNFNNRIEEVMSTAMHNIRSLVDVDIVVGQPIATNSNATIIPLTKVTVGFVSGGGEYNADLKEMKKDTQYPFAGGSGAGLNLQPIGFLVVSGGVVKIVKIDSKSAIEKLIETVPEVAKFLSKTLREKTKNDKKQES